MPSRHVPQAGSVAIGLLILSLVVLLMVLTAKGPMPEEKLALLVDESAPSWSNYDEDLKAQLGATPVAEWEGAPTRIEWDGGVLTILFTLTGDWAERDFGIPVLVKLPSGNLVRNEPVTREGSEVRYRFVTGLNAPPQWVTVRYPFYGERRIVLSEKGTWEGK